MTLIRQPSVQSPGAWGPAESKSLRAGLAQIGLNATPAQVAKLQTYARLLLKWNRTYNLLGATTPQAVIDSHLLDSLATMPVLERWLPAGNPPLLDIGSGAGLPGIVLAIMLEQMPIALVEPIGKKTAFLRQAVAQCGLPLARVLEGRVEDLDLSQDLPQATTKGSRAAPHFICRAFTSLERFAALCTPHLAEGSLLFAMKAARVGEELAQLSRSVVSGSIEVLAVEPLRTIEKDVQRNLVVMRAAALPPSWDTTRPGHR